MKFFLMPKEPTWWTWLTIAVLLAFGVAGSTGALYAAIAISVFQSGWSFGKFSSFKPYPAQIRLAYAGLLFIGLVPGLFWIFWIPTLGTFALVLFGYCLMARVLSLMPWNRSEPITRNLFVGT